MLAKVLASSASFNTLASIQRHCTHPLQRETLAGGVDMVICTPGRFTEHLAAGNVNLEAAKAVVMDEVDVLMGGCSSFLFGI
jgi:hypothetical protein